MLLAWVEVDEERLTAAHRQRRREVDGSGRLADSPFLIGDGDDHGLSRSVNRSRPL
jgi:hypothetical protein